MTTLLERGRGEFEADFLKIDPVRTRIRGTMLPVSASSLPVAALVLPRVAFRTRPQEPVQAGCVIEDVTGRRFLLADHDLPLTGDVVNSKLYALIQVTGRYPWSRVAVDLDPITQEPRSKGAPTLLGQIWGAMEMGAGATKDQAFRVQVNHSRFLTNALLQHGDTVAGKVVKEVTRALGISIAEVE